MARRRRPSAIRRFYFGFGYGSDQNGLSSQPHPREGPNPVQYPFKSFDGRVTFERQRSGVREFDITKDGVAHYGLFPDWWEDIRRVGGEAAVKRHGARGGGLPRGVGARERDPLRLQVAEPAVHAARARSPAPARQRRAAAAKGRPAEGPRQLGLELVRARQEEPRQARGGGADECRQGGARRQEHERPEEGAGRRAAGSGMACSFAAQALAPATSTACATAASGSGQWLPGRRRRTPPCCAATWGSRNSAEPSTPARQERLTRDRQRVLRGSRLRIVNGTFSGRESLPAESVATISAR